jgi:hypothetical protein
MGKWNNLGCHSYAPPTLAASSEGT